jgi:nitrogen fixation protein NifB
MSSKPVNTAAGTAAATATPCVRPHVRLDLPVAPRRNAMGAFETVPATAELPAISPADALALLDAALDASLDVTTIKISGPGDPLAEPAPVLDTLRAVRAAHPDMALQLVTNGLHVALFADDLAALDVAHVTLLVDAVDAALAERLYAWVRPGRKTLPRAEAAALLVEQQAEAMRALAARSVPVTVRTTLHGDVNAAHAPEVARVMAGLGAANMRIVRATPGTDSRDDAPAPVSKADYDAIKAEAARHLPLVEDADCPTRTGNARTPCLDLADLPEGRELLARAGRPTAFSTPTGERPYVAVASESGMEVDAHLGHALRFLIYGKGVKTSQEGMVGLLEMRTAPAPGSGDARWQELAETLSDCCVVLCAGAGERPREILGRTGLRVVVTQGDVEGVVEALYGGGKKPGKGRGKGSAPLADGGNCSA